MANLTTFQEKLLKELTNEFNRINPQEKQNSGVKRFTLSSIDSCKNEETKFIESIKKHNESMRKLFLKQFDNDIKQFKKEFGKAFDIQIGYVNKYNSLKTINNGLETFSNDKIADYNEMYVFIVSKTQAYTYNDNYNYCNNKKYTQLYVGFKFVRVDIVLESEKNVRMYKVVGLNYSNKDYLSNKGGDAINKSTLDEFIQSSKYTQQKMVEMA